MKIYSWKQWKLCPLISDIFYIWPNMQACASNITMLLSVSSLESFPQGGRHEYKYKYKYAASGHTLTRNRFNLTHNIYLYLVTISPVGALMTLLFGTPGPRHSWMKRGLWSLPPFSVLSCKKNCLWPVLEGFLITLGAGVNLEERQVGSFCWQVMQEGRVEEW